LISWPAAVAAGLLAVSSIVSAFVAHSVVHEEEHRLLEERAAEAGLYTSSAFGSLTSELGTLATGSLLTNPPQAGFAKVAVQQRLVGSGESAALVGRSGSGYAVLASVGPALQLGAPVTGARAAAVAQALHQTGLLSTTILTRTKAGASIGFALGPPSAPAGEVVYLEITIPPTAGTVKAFSELTAALYTVPRPDPAQLLLTANGHMPSGNTVSEAVTIGSTQWLLVVGARAPLVGTLATITPWLLLGGLLLSAALVAWALESVSRRRDYAMVLVDERTAELRESLSELRSTQAQLVHSERLAAVGELASTVGHELRNPLAVISNSLYLIRAATAPTADDRLRRQLSTAEREVSAATVIITDLLEYARARPPIIDRVDLVGLVNEALEVIPAPTGITVTWAPPPGLPLAAGDRDQLRQVLLNLVGNGFDAMPNGGHLSIEAMADADLVVVRVADDGVGMPPETVAHIFEPFFTTKARGTGLGLAVTDRIIRSHGGTLAVSSTVGTGTVFTLTLPKAVGER
jgi:signal transduction histidine kinase